MRSHQPTQTAGPPNQDKRAGKVQVNQKSNVDSKNHCYFRKAKGHPILISELVVTKIGNHLFPGRKKTNSRPVLAQKAGW